MLKAYLSAIEYVIGRRIERTSERAQVLGGNTDPVRRSCQDYKSTLYILPQDQKLHVFRLWTEIPIAEQQQQNKGRLGTLDNSNSIGDVQPQNYQGRRLQPLRPLRLQSPLEAAKGYTVIDS
jgi:hypothetical protein